MTQRIELLRRGGLVQQHIAAVAGAHVKINGRWVLNFTSSSYLGFQYYPHVRRILARSAHMTGISLGTPRVLGIDHGTSVLEAQIARLVRQERALIFASTTHLALDVLPLLAGSDGTIVIDEQAYPLSFQGAFAATQRGAAIVRFAHNDPVALRRQLRKLDPRSTPVIVCDGVYPAGGSPAALGTFNALARQYGATLYVDDAHGVGVLGAQPSVEHPYGLDGSGTPRFMGVTAGGLAHVGSLSKAFGVPLAFVAGPAHMIEQVAARAPSFVHASPPAPPIVAAASAVLRVHAALGDRARHCLLRRVQFFRERASRSRAYQLGSSLFPLQTLYFRTADAALVAGCSLRAQDIWPIVQFKPPDHPAGGVLRFAITVRHTTAELDRAVDALERARRAA